MEMEPDANLALRRIAAVLIERDLERFAGERCLALRWPRWVFAETSERTNLHCLSVNLAGYDICIYFRDEELLSFANQDGDAQTRQRLHCVIADVDYLQRALAAGDAYLLPCAHTAAALHDEHSRLH